MTEEKIKYVGTVVTDKVSYGFIKCDKLEENTFYHYTQCNPKDRIRVGDVVEFEISESRFGRSQATNVHLIRDKEGYATKE
jgi:cold shock CspA family protein